MTTKEREILSAALSLPMASRVMILQALEDSLTHETDSDEIHTVAIEKAWIKEAEDRLAAYERGEIKAVPGEQVLRRLRARITK